MEDILLAKKIFRSLPLITLQSVREMKECDRERLAKCEQMCLELKIIAALKELSMTSDQKIWIFFAVMSVVVVVVNAM